MKLTSYTYAGRPEIVIRLVDEPVKRWQLVESGQALGDVLFKNLSRIALDAMLNRIQQRFDELDYS